MACKKSKLKDNNGIDICDPFYNTSFNNKRKTPHGRKISKKVTRYNSDYTFIFSMEDSDYYEIGVNKERHRIDDNELFNEDSDNNR